MKVIVADNCGFCPGVRNAISLAEQTLKDSENVYSLGPVIHNKDVVDKLAQQGLKTVNNPEEIPSGTVLIRSHGAAPQVLEQLKAKGLKIIDATCVLVKRVQGIAQQLEADGYKVVIIGDKDHPEIQAVVGCVKNIVVVANEQDLHRLPENSRLGIICQTTQSPQFFSSMLSAIAQHGFSEMKVINTLCKEAIKRQESAVQLCKKVDVMFVLGGLDSANTRKLAELCKKHNAQTYHLQNWDGLDKNVLSDKKVVGITAGASTPQWVISEFTEKLKK